MSGFRERAVAAAWRLAANIARPLYLRRVRGRGEAEPLYAEAIGERSGRYGGAAPGPGAVWVHAVSLGETRAAAPLLAALRVARPGTRVVLTHGTATGRAAGAGLLAPGDVQAWLPWDDAGSVERFLGHFRPAAGVLMETEIWPTLLARAARHGVPMFLANARMSARSRSRFDRAAWLLRPAYASLAAVFAQSEAGAARLREAGAAPVTVMGNLKFDVDIDAALFARGSEWRAATAGRRVLLAAVTRDGEEAALLDAWRALDAAPARPLLAIVPRHPQRFDAVAALVAGAGFALSRRSAWVDSSPPAEAERADVWLGDAMLEMPAWYALADVALLGGSFEPVGGQNLIEACACGCPLVMGPHTFNFADAAAGAEASGAAVRVGSMRDAVMRAEGWLHDGPALAAASAAARSFAAAHRGAAAATAAAIVARLPPCVPAVPAGFSPSADRPA